MQENKKEISIWLSKKFGEHHDFFTPDGLSFIQKSCRERGINYNISYGIVNIHLNEFSTFLKDSRTQKTSRISDPCEYMSFYICLYSLLDLIYNV